MDYLIRIVILSICAAIHIAATVYRYYDIRERNRARELDRRRENT